MKDRILFNNIVIIRPIYFALIGLFIIAPIAYILGSILPFSGAKLWGFFAGLTIAMLIFRTLRKTIRIAFDGNYIKLSVNQRTISYRKSDIDGFYSFDYRTASNYTISICIYFKDGKRLNLSDYNLKPACKDEERRQQLLDFTTTMEKELGFRPIKENKTRKFLRLGYIWFSR